MVKLQNSRLLDQTKTSQRYWRWMELNGE